MKAAIIQAIVDKKLTGSQIAREFGVSRQYVYILSEMAGAKPYREEKKSKPAKPICWVTLEAREYAASLGLPDPRAKYNAHKSTAKQRGIEFKLSFSEWWALWKPYYPMRGTKKGSYCMCRKLDSGHYEVGNVRIDLVQSNGHEKKTAKVVREGTRWRRQYTTNKNPGEGLYNPVMCQAEELDSNDDLWDHSSVQQARL